MKIIVARHGNTFGPNDKVVWVGARNDLPLVARGREQARDVGVGLCDHDTPLAGIYCGPLARTREFAAIVAQEIEWTGEPVVDPRLNELDYGAWSGLTTEEITAKFGAAAVTAWDERAEWPATANWGGSAATVHAEVRAFVADLEKRHPADATVLVVSSNGRLRAFAALAEPGALLAAVKMKTGHIGMIEGSGDRWIRHAWNEEPL